MDENPRLVARSETGSGTRLVRPLAAVPRSERVRQQGPPVDPDDLIRARGADLASGAQWWVRLNGEEFWWDSIGGYTRYRTNARKWDCRWDAYTFMLGQEIAGHSWAIEQVPPPRGATATGLAGGAQFDDLTQAWTHALSGPEGRPVPEDGMVHALVGGNVPARALCGLDVGHWTDRPWPPRGIRRCERCNSIATVLPRA